jgi:hypothetical protein
MGWTAEVLVPLEARDFPFSIKSSPDSYTTGTGDYFLGGKAIGAWR